MTDPWTWKTVWSGEEGLSEEGKEGKIKTTVVE